MTNTSPRIRVDLQASPVEDADGVLYFDVSDPKTGTTLRLFDFEWLLAQRLNGQHNLDDLVQFTETELGFSTSRADLEVYADKLHQLGLVELVAVAAAPAAKPEPVATAPVTPVATPVITPPRPVEPLPAARPVEPEPLRPAPLPPGAGDSDDGLMGRPVISLPPPRPQPAAAKPVSAESKPVKAAPEPVAAAPSKPTKAVSEPAPAPRSALQDALEGLPAPAESVAAAPPAKPEAPTAPAAAELNALSASPTALLEQVSKPSESKTVPLEPVAAPPTVETSAQTPVKAPPAVEASAQTPVKPAEPVVKPAEPVAAKPAEPVVKPVEPAVKPAEPVVKPAEPAVKPAEPAVKPTPAVEPPPVQKSGGSTWIVVVLLVVVAIAAAYYFLVFKPKQSPPALSVKMAVAKVEDVPRTFPAPAEVKKAEPQVLKVGADGTVTKVAAENDEVTPETPLVVLDVQSKLEKELGELRTRIEQLQKKVETAKGKAKQDNQTKIEEKQARVGEVESLLKKAQLVAPRPGTVSKVMVKVGDAVTAGTDAVAVADKALAAEIKVPALEAQGLKVGQEAKLSGASSPISAQVVSVKTEGDVATLGFTLPLDATVKVGDKLSLQRGLVEKAARLPAAAVVEGNKVYVAQEGKALLRQVTVADRDGEDVLVQGLSQGDQVIVSHPPELHENSPVTAAPTVPVQ